MHKNVEIYYFLFTKSKSSFYKIWFIWLISYTEGEWGGEEIPENVNIYKFLKEAEPLSGSFWILWKTTNFEFTTQTHIPIMKIGFKNRHWEIFVFYVTELWNFYGLRNGNWNFYGLRNTLSVQLYSYVTSVPSVFVSDKIITNSDNFSAYLRVK